MPLFTGATCPQLWPSTTAMISVSKKNSYRASTVRNGATLVTRLQVINFSTGCAWDFWVVVTALVGYYKILKAKKALLLEQ